MFNRTINYEIIDFFRFHDGPTEFVTKEMKYISNRLLDETKNFTGSAIDCHNIRQDLIYFMRQCVSWVKAGYTMYPLLEDTTVNEIMGFTDEEICDFVEELKNNYNF